jgi:hypothetical protein
MNKLFSRMVCNICMGGHVSSGLAPTFLCVGCRQATVDIQLQIAVPPSVATNLSSSPTRIELAHA